MIININPVSVYPSALTAPIKAKDEASTADAKADEATSRTVKFSNGPAEAGAAQSTEASSPSDEIIKQLQKQIEQVQAQIEQQQAQLAAVQNSKASDQAKAQQVMAIQQQIAGSMAQLTSLQGALMQALKGSVNTTA